VRRLLAYAAIYILWGASFLAIREIVHVMPPFFAAAVRFSAAGAILLIYAIARGLKQPRGIEWRNLVIVAILLFATAYGCLFWVEQKIPSGLAAVIAATIPAWVFLIEWLWLRRVRLTPMTAGGLVMGLGGVAMLVLPPGFFAGGVRIDRYTAIAAAGSIVWAIGTVLSTTYKFPGARPISVSWQMLIGGIALFAVSGLAGEWSHVTTAAWTPRVWIGMAYLVIGASLVAFTAYVYLLAHEPAGRVASYAYVNPIIALAIGTLLAGETLTHRQAIASAIVIGGVLLTLFGKSGATAALVARTAPNE
jgi:drug/metabolite transporter (DMT)-like permease